MKVETQVRHRYVEVDGVRLFYREAGDPARPTLLLLHGFPASSHMYRDLLPLLAPHFHLVAPDYPGFGHSEAPSAATYTPTFERLAQLMTRFTEVLGLRDYLVYMQDFGGPVGFRMAVAHPERVRGLIVQNANAYEEGIAPDVLAGMRGRSGEATPEKFADAATLVNRETAEFFYRHGVRDPEALNPDAWTLDAAVLENPEAKRILTALIVDYYSNVLDYPRWHAYLRQHQPATLVLWGRNDPVFPAAGAEAYRRDLPQAQVQLFDTGHFALEEDRVPIAQAIVDRYANA